MKSEYIYVFSFFYEIYYLKMEIQDREIII